jgi:hypothetical protein
LLVPAFIVAKSRAKMTVCASNMRQVYLGFDLYASDYDGWEHPAPSISALKTYVASEVLKCPDHLPVKLAQGYREQLMVFPPTKFTSYPISYIYIRDTDPVNNDKNWRRVLQHPSVGLFACSFHGSLNSQYVIPSLLDLQPRIGPVNRVCIDGHLRSIARTETSMVSVLDLFYLPESAPDVLFVDP